MKQNQLLLIPLLIFLSSCGGVSPGNDPVLVHSQQTMEQAKAAFELVEKTEYDTYSAFKAADPTKAAEVRTFVNRLRSDSPKWLSTAYSLTETYRTNRDETNKANLNTALAVLQAAITKSQEYTALLTSHKS